MTGLILQLFPGLDEGVEVAHQLPGKARASSDMSDNCRMQIGQPQELLVMNSASDLQGNSPGPVVNSDQTWEDVQNNVFLTGMC